MKYAINLEIETYEEPLTEDQIGCVERSALFGASDALEGGKCVLLSVRTFAHETIKERMVKVDGTTRATAEDIWSKAFHDPQYASVTSHNRRIDLANLAVEAFIDAFE